MKRLFATLSLSCLCFLSFAQVSIEERINNMNDNSTKITQARYLIAKDIASGNIAEVKEVMDYIDSLPNEDYLPFCESEKALLQYWVGDYNAVINDVLNPNMDNQPKKYLGGEGTALYYTLYNTTRSKLDSLRTDIVLAHGEKMDKDFLDLYLCYLAHSGWEIDALNDLAFVFLNNYPNSPYDRVVRNTITTEMEERPWSGYISFAAGAAFSTGQLQNYKKVWGTPLAMTMGAEYKKLSFGIYMNINAGELNKDLNVKNSVYGFDKGSTVNALLLGLEVGYSAYENRSLKLIPQISFGGIGVNAPENDVQKDPDLEKAEKGALAYGLGFSFDYKIGGTKQPRHVPKSATYQGIRLQYRYLICGLDNKYVGATGNMHCITLGYILGGHSYRKTNYRSTPMNPMKIRN